VAMKHAAAKNNRDDDATANTGPATATAPAKTPIGPPQKTSPVVAHPKIAHGHRDVQHPPDRSDPGMHRLPPVMILATASFTAEISQTSTRLP
jgi:hypothetical protein